MWRSESLVRTVLEGRTEGTRTHGRQIDRMKSNDVEYEYIKKELMIEKTGITERLDLPEKAEHSMNVKRLQGHRTKNMKKTCITAK